jgi:hypothetical protein
MVVEGFSYTRSKEPAAMSTEHGARSTEHGARSNEHGARTETATPNSKIKKQVKKKISATMHTTVLHFTKQTPQKIGK